MSLDLRPIEEADMTEAMKLLKACFDFGKFSGAGHSFNHDSVKKACVNLINNKSALAVGAFYEDRLEGIAIFIAASDPMDEDKKRLVEFTWDVNPIIVSKTLKSRIMSKLYHYVCQHFEDEIDSIEISIPVTSKVGSFLLKKGFLKSEETYVREVS